MENNDLLFLDSFTVEQFKDKMKTNKLEVLPSKTKGKMFFSYGPGKDAVGAVTQRGKGPNGIPLHPVVSYVQGTPTEENPSGKFYLLHEEGEGRTVLATF